MDKILIVDGYQSVRELVAEELASEGNIVVAIGNPELIGGLIETFDPDLIILDLYNNGRMRWHVLKEIKRQSPQLPVVIFTSTYPERDLHLPQVEGWVIKSFIFDELKEKIDEILKRRALGANKRKNLTQEEIRGSNIEALARWKREGAGSISLQ
jgi:DNA-binding response OmpR family regulator